MSREIFTRYIASYGDDTFHGKSIPIGVVEVKGYYRMANADNWFENQYSNENGLVFIRTDKGGEQLMSYYDAHVTDREAQRAYNKECMWRIGRYQERVNALKDAIKI